MPPRQERVRSWSVFGTLSVCGEEDNQEGGAEETRKTEEQKTRQTAGKVP